jgi:hypothetical protein
MYQQEFSNGDTHTPWLMFLIVLIALSCGFGLMLLG